jgi:hypothetical protein
MATFPEAEPLAQAKMIAARSQPDRRNPTDIRTPDVRSGLNFYR